VWCHPDCPEPTFWCRRRPRPKGDRDWKAFRLSGQDPLAVRTSKKPRNDELLVTTFAGTVLRTHLDRVPSGHALSRILRGEAHLAARQGQEAVAEFQKILDHRGIVLSDPVGALANLQLGHAHEMAGDSAKQRQPTKIPSHSGKTRPRHPHPEASQSRVCEAAIDVFDAGLRMPR
jgi:hypothetical protein